MTHSAITSEGFAATRKTSLKLPATWEAKYIAQLECLKREFTTIRSKQSASGQHNAPNERFLCVSMQSNKIYIDIYICIFMYIYIRNCLLSYSFIFLDPSTQIVQYEHFWKSFLSTIMEMTTKNWCLSIKIGPFTKQRQTIHELSPFTFSQFNVILDWVRDNPMNSYINFQKKSKIHFFTIPLNSWKRKTY